MTSELSVKTLGSSINSLLKDMNVSTELWADAVVTAACVINGSPMSSLEKKTLYEALTGWKPRVDHLLVFWVRLLCSC